MKFGENLAWFSLMSIGARSVFSLSVLFILGVNGSSQQFGEFRFVMAIITFLVMFGKLGSDNPMLRCVMDVPDKRGQIDFLNLVQIFLIWILVFTASAFISNIHDYSFLVLVFTSVMSFNLLYGEYKCVLVKRLRFLYSVRIAANLGSALVIFLFSSRWHVAGLLWSLCFIEIGISVALILFGSRVDFPSYSNFLSVFNSKKNRQFFLASTFSTLAATQTYQSFELVFLGVSNNFSVVGAFAAVSLVAQFGLLFSAASVVRGYILPFLVKYENESSVLSETILAVISFSSLQILLVFLAFEITHANLELPIFDGIKMEFVPLIFLSHLLTGILMIFAPLISATKSYSALYYTGMISLLFIIAILNIQPSLEMLVAISLMKNVILVVVYWWVIKGNLLVTRKQLISLGILFTVILSMIISENPIVHGLFIVGGCMFCIPTWVSVWRSHRGFII